MSQSNITVEVDENRSETTSCTSFELHALTNSQTENVLKYLIPDNDGFDDLIKVLGFPQQNQGNLNANRSISREHQNNNRSSLMNPLPVPFLNNC